MAHLSGFGLENFRVFKDYTWFDFAPITLFVGPNSSGKSSVIKALLLLKDNYDRNTLFTKAQKSLLKFDGGMHNLSSGKNVLNSMSNENQFKFVFDYDSKDFKVGLKYELIYEINNNTTRKYSYTSLKTETDELLFRLTSRDVYLNIPRLLEYMVSEEELINSIENLNKLIEENSLYDNWFFYEADKRETENRLDKIRIVRNFFNKKNWKVNTLLYADYFDKNKPFFKQEYVGEDEYGFPHIDSVEMTKEEFIDKITSRSYTEACSPIFREAGQEWFTKETNEQATEAFHTVLKILNIEDNENEAKQSDQFSYLERILYLPSIKGQSKRSYQSNEEHIINSIIKNYKESTIDGMNEYLTKWQNFFGIGEIVIEKDDRLDANYITVDDRSLTDLGFGLSQLTALLITVGLHSNQIKNTLILEEPETNLHPKYQSLLSNLFAEASRQNQFIIETHSEYLIRKFQYLMAKGEMKPEDIVIYYFHDPNNVPAGEKQIKKITILEDGSLSDDFGPGFYDEAAHWELELLKLKRNKGRQN